MPMTEKVCIVTGANSGIGLATALGLAKLDATVVLACRDEGRGNAARQEIQRQTKTGQLELLLVDLSSFDSIRRFADSFQAKYNRLDVLINNAAIVPRKRTLTQDGIEAQFGVNHLAPFLLTHLLLDCLKASAPSRIVNVASTVHHGAAIDFDDLQGEHGYGLMKNYGRSKLANVLFTYELARRLEGTGVTANCLHPGVVNTRIMRDLPGFLQPLVKGLGAAFMLNPEKGARTSLYAATAPELEGVTGKYFAKSTEAPSSKESHDPAAAKRLWDISAEMTGLP